MTPIAGETEASAPRGLLTRTVAPLTALLRRRGAGTTMARGALWSIGSTVIGAGLSFVTQVILARHLEPTRYGVYSYLLAWVNVAVLVGKLEFDTAAVRFVGAYDGQRQDGFLHGFLRQGWRVVGGTATGVALVAGLAAWLLGAQLPAGAQGAVWAACVLVPLSASLLYSSSALQGFRRVPQAQVPPLVLRPALFAVGIVAVSALGWRLGAGGAVAINAAATAAALGASLLLLGRAVPATTISAAPVFESAKWMRAVRGFLVISAAQLVLSQQADILVVGTLLAPRDAGLYSVGSQLSTLIGLGATAVIFVVLPVISDLHARGRRAELQRLVVRTVQACAAVSIPVAVLLGAAGPVVLRAYGPAFVDAYPVLLVLSVAQLVGAMIGALSGYLLTMTGHEWEATRAIVGSALLNLALTFVLTPTFGAVGTAVATVVALLTKVAWLQWYTRRHLGVTVLPYLPAGAMTNEAQ